MAWAALRRRSGRPGSGGSLRRHGFERGCLASSGGPPPRAILFSTLQNSRELFCLLTSACSPRGREGLSPSMPIHWIPG